MVRNGDLVLGLVIAVLMAASEVATEFSMAGNPNPGGDLRFEVVDFSKEVTSSSVYLGGNVRSGGARRDGFMVSTTVEDMMKQ